LLPRWDFVATMTQHLRGLLLVEEPLELGAAHDRARADLDRLDAATADQGVKERSRDAEIVGGLTDREARQSWVVEHGEPRIVPAIR
jgi:hypothetical protein